jgi:phage gp29-like protein
MLVLLLLLPVVAVKAGATNEHPQTALRALTAVGSRVGCIFPHA